MARRRYKPYDYARADRERAEGRPAIIARYRAVLRAADQLPLAQDTLAAQYRESARKLRARHQLTEEEINA